MKKVIIIVAIIGIILGYICGRNVHTVTKLVTSNGEEVIVAVDGIWVAEEEG